jgi:hypothetical protein
MSGNSGQSGEPFRADADPEMPSGSRSGMSGVEVTFVEDLQTGGVQVLLNCLLDGECSTASGVSGVHVYSLSGDFRWRVR